MCGRIILNKKVITPGTVIPTIIQGLKVNKTFGVNLGVGYSYNARSETWEQKWGTCDWKLCKIPVEGFIEGSKRFEGNFLLSGLYKGQNCLILTQDASEEVLPYHRRMPVFLNQDYKLLLAA